MGDTNSGGGMGSTLGGMGGTGTSYSGGKEEGPPPSFAPEVEHFPISKPQRARENRLGLVPYDRRGHGPFVQLPKPPPRPSIASPSLFFKLALSTPSLSPLRALLQ